MPEQIIDVLIVGAGPVGLFCANELERQGLTCRIIDKKQAISDKSKALGLHIRSLDVFKDCGFLDKILKEGLKIDGLLLKSDKKTLANLSFSEVSADYHFLIDLPQNRTETILYESYLDKGGEVEWQKELIDLKQDKEKITATVSFDEKEETIIASYLIGCDGSHSKVRDCLKVPFLGNAYKETWWLADLFIDWTMPRDKMIIFASEKGPLACFPIGEDRYRIIATAPKNKVDKELTLADLTEVFNERSKEMVSLSNPIWLSKFGIAHRQIEQYRHQRIFFAGDAAHIHSPIGGQGLNTGLQDIYNLCWKLALVHNNKAHDSLLDSYQLERHPIAKDVIKKTDFMTHLITLKNPFFISLRNQVLKLLTSFKFIRQKALTEVAELNLSYAKSPVVSQLGKKSQFKAGSFLNNFSLEDITTNKIKKIHDLVQGTEHHLLIFTGQSAKIDKLIELSHFIEERFSTLIKCHLIFPTSTMQKIEFSSQFRETINDEKVFNIQESTFVLIRPDKYIGLTAVDVKQDELLEALGKTFK